MNGDENNTLTPLDIDLIAKSGSLREALNLALKEIRAGAREIDLFYLAARIAFELGDLTKSEQLIKHLLAIDPEHLNGWVLFGKVFHQKGDLTRSNYGLRRAEEIFPDLSEQDLLGELKKDETRKIAGGAQRGTGHKEIFETETYADICVKQGYLNKALKIYSDLREQYPDNAGLERKIDELKKKMEKHD
jgi:tetratricopeptide (TPR) repeat protein